jgi:Cys-tRNA(Pro)/Cys-tRNA(Cys) deacylase
MHELKKTNACRLLDKANVDYEIVAYQVHETDLSAPVVAASLGEPVEQVFKTIVLTGDKMK